MKYVIASLVLAFAFLGIPHDANAYGIADSFRYEKPHTSVKRHGVHHPVVRHSYGRSAVPSKRLSYRDGRPRAWCGWWARHQKGVDNPSYNRAIYWLNYGKPTSPQVGAVVVWSHHVGIITGRDHRGWLVTSGNWNNRVATVPLSQMGRGVRGYRI